ncbi:MAG: hypothetical protein U0350_33610 [Caldilineaceae bacterium]
MFTQLIPAFTLPAWGRRGRRSVTRILIVALLAAASFTSARPAYAAGISVDGTTCTLADAITAANNNIATGGCTAGSSSAVDVLTLTADVTLTGPLPVITSDMTIQGDSAARFVSGANNIRVFTVNGGTVTFQTLTIKDGNDIGGAGSSGYAGGGGGMGAGGGLYIADGKVTVQNVTFTNNKATGGVGASDSSGDGGNGGNSTNDATAGGAGGTASTLANGADGKFGGGGGGLGGDDGTGSAGSVSGKGGFGGGSGGGYTIAGGFGGGGGDINSYAGGGGAGLGGAIFIQKGALILNNSTFTNNSATGGQGGADSQIPPISAPNGQGIGGAIFICTSSLDAVCGATVGTSGTNTFSGNSADTNADTYGTIATIQSLQPTSQLTQQTYTQSCTNTTGTYVKNCTLKFTLLNSSPDTLQIRSEQITSISSHVYVLNGTPNPGQFNAVVNDVQSVASGASFKPSFTLGLKSSTTYTVRFKVYGYAGAVAAAGADQAQAVELGEYEATITPDAVGAVHLFLPVVSR